MIKIDMPFAVLITGVIILAVAIAYYDSDIESRFERRTIHGLDCLVNDESYRYAITCDWSKK